MSDVLVAEYKKDGETLEIWLDTTPEDPRTRYENLGTMVCKHRRYVLGDEVAKNIEYYSSWNSWFYGEIVRENGGWRNIIALPLFLMDHSGLCMNTEGFYYCDPYGWDWGQVGWIYTTKEKVRKVFGVKRVTKKLEAEVKRILKDEVKIYSEYLQGNVFGFVLKDQNGNVKDSGWGFYGDDFRSIAECVGEKWQTCFH